MFADAGQQGFVKVSECSILGGLAEPRELDQQCMLNARGFRVAEFG
jgi:hypothetical protein